MSLPRRKRLAVFALTCLAVLVAACQPATPSTGLALPTLAGWPLPSDEVCDMVGLGPRPFTLEGSLADGVYGLNGDGERIPTQWPPGYVATFTPALAVHAPDGTIVAKAGDDLYGAIRGGLAICLEPSLVMFIPLGRT